MTAGVRWPSNLPYRNLSKPLKGDVRAIMWPTCSLVGGQRWFDEMHVWTERFQASTMQRVRIQRAALQQAFAMLETERVPTVAVTLSFGTVERALDLVTDLFDAHRLVQHRLAVLLRGDVERLRSPYRVRGFVDHLRTQHVPVGYRIDAPRLSMELRTFDFLRPDFVKIIAPEAPRLELWQDLGLEARVGGLTIDWLIVAGIETSEQKKLATEAGFQFGQGRALRAPYDPPIPLAEAVEAPARGADPPAGPPVGPP